MAFPTGWTQLAHIQIDYTKVSGSSNLTNFPALIKDGNLPANVYSNIEADGKDLRFTTDSAGTTEVPFEIVSITPASSLCEIWLKIPSALYAANTDIYVWGNNSGASAYAATDPFGSQAVWSGYKLVDHLQGASNDVTAIGNVETDTGVTYNTTNGKFNQGAGVANSTPTSGAVGYIKTPQSSNLSPGTGDFVISLWMKTSDARTSARWLITSYNNAATNNVIALNLSSTNHYLGLTIRDTDGDSTTVSDSVAINDGAWHHIVCVRVGTSNKLYKDGAIVGTNTNASLGNINLNDANSGLHFGCYATGISTIGQEAQSYNGAFDDIRVGQFAPSADWIATEYANQNSPSTFWISTFFVSITDDGSGTDAVSPLNLVFSTDTGAGTDTNSLLASIPQVDSGSGDDVLSFLRAHFVDDSAIGLESKSSSYYINASDAGPVDTANIWNNDSSAFDGNENTYADTPVVQAGNLTADGTNAPTSGPTIINVSARTLCSSDLDSPAWSSYVHLFVPTGGWTWQKVSDLTSLTWLQHSFGDRIITGISLGGTQLGGSLFNEISEGFSSLRLHKIEINVAYEDTVLIAAQATVTDAGEATEAVPVAVTAMVTDTSSPKQICSNYLSPGTAGDNSSAGNGPWTNKDNIKVEDAVFATADNHSVNHVKDVAARIILDTGTISTHDYKIATDWDSTLKYVDYNGGLWGETLTPEVINDVDFGFALRIGGGVLTSYYLLATNFGFAIPTGVTISSVTVQVKRKDGLGDGSGGSTIAYIDHIRMKVCYIDPETDSETTVFSSPSFLVADSGEGIDEVTAQLIDILISDSGSGVDSVMQVSAFIPVSDTAAGVDTLIKLVSAVIGDSGEGEDSLGIGRFISVDDTGVGIETLLLVQFVDVTDLGSGIDTIGSVLAYLTILDVGVATDLIRSSLLDKSIQVVVEKSSPDVDRVRPSMAPQVDVVSSAPSL